MDNSGPSPKRRLEVFCVSGHNKRGANRTMKVKGLCENKVNVWHQNKAYVDPPIHYLTSVIVS